jgi:hypothetical protein
MDELVFRLLRELPDTDKDRYDIAYERGRAQARSSLLFGGMTVGLLAGGLALFLLDPVVGAGRRAHLTRRARTVLNDLQGTIHDLRHRTTGPAPRLGLPSGPQSPIEGRDVVAATAAASRHVVRTPPRSAVASAVRRQAATDRVPIAAGTEEG